MDRDVWVVLLQRHSFPGLDSFPIRAAVPEDALTYTPKGFLWTAAEAKGLTARLYGEWSDNSKVAKKPDGSNYTWSDFYRTAQCKEGSALCVELHRSGRCDPRNLRDSLGGKNHWTRIIRRSISPFPTNTAWIIGCSEFQRLDAASQVPQSDPVASGRSHRRDHEGPTLANQLPWPTTIWPLGRMVDAISHSKVWAQSAIFVEEDDSQDGVAIMRMGTVSLFM